VTFGQHVAKTRSLIKVKYLHLLFNLIIPLPHSDAEDNQICYLKNMDLNFNNFSITCVQICEYAHLIDKNVS